MQATYNHALTRYVFPLPEAMWVMRTTRANGVTLMPCRGKIPGKHMRAPATGTAAVWLCPVQFRIVKRYKCSGDLATLQKLFCTLQ